MTTDEYQNAVVAALTAITTKLDDVNSKLVDLNNKLGSLNIKINATNKGLADINTINSALVHNTRRSRFK